MRRRRLSKRMRPTPMCDYGRALRELGAENAAAIDPHLPDGAGDLDQLGTLCEEVLASDALWLKLSSDRDVIFERYERAAGTAGDLYEQTRGYMQLAASKLEDSGDVDAFLGRSPARSALKPAALPSAMQHLRDGIATYAAAFPRLSADAPRLAAFDAARDALIGALAAYSSAELARANASSRRKKGRADLLKQIRVVERALRRGLTDDEYGQVARLCALHLPLINSAGKEGSEGG